MVEMILDGLFDGEPAGTLPLREPILVESGTVVRAALARMRATEIGCAVVVTTGDRPIGLFTERSLLGLLMEDESLLDQRPVSDFTDFDCPVVRDSDPISSVWQVIQTEGARFVCVTDDNGKLIGLTGQRGLAEYVSDCFASEVTVQRIGGQPWMQDREGA